MPGPGGGVAGGGVARHPTGAGLNPHDSQKLPLQMRRNPSAPTAAWPTVVHGSLSAGATADTGVARRSVLASTTPLISEDEMSLFILFFILVPIRRREVEEHVTGRKRAGRAATGVGVTEVRIDRVAWL